MGSESSNCDSNSSKYDSDSSSNSGNASGELEKMIFLKENENTTINRVWIAKKSISHNDVNVLAHPIFLFGIGDKFMLKHWAIILELSNDSYVNIQFGRNGFSLKEGKNILDIIKETWGEKYAPIYFCYLGNANYEYENLKRYLKEIKDIETKKFEEEGKTFYNHLFYNCQDFACEIEKVLFNKIKILHFFSYNLYEFVKNFFMIKNSSIRKII